MLKAGLIGLGMMGRNHARVMASTEGVELVGIADPMGDPEGVVDKDLLCESVEELISLGIDLAVVACPTTKHEEVALELSESGVHALVEKPLSESLESAEKITNAFEKKGLVGAVGHIERFNPAVRNLRRRIDNGDLGDLYQISTQRIGPFSKRIQDVGVVMDLATHDLDLSAWVGGALFEQVSAKAAYKTGRSHEDLVAITGQLTNGVVTNHLVNWISPMKQRYVMATGEQGSFVADTLLADLIFYKNGDAPPPWEGISKFRGVSEGDVIRFSIAKPEPLREEFEGFRDAILGKKGEIVSMREGLAAVVAAEAVLRSISIGSNQKVES